MENSDSGFARSFHTLLEDIHRATPPVFVRERTVDQLYARINEVITTPFFSPGGVRAAMEDIRRDFAQMVAFERAAYAMHRSPVPNTLNAEELSPPRTSDDFSNLSFEELVALFVRFPPVPPEIVQRAPSDIFERRPSGVFPSPVLQGSDLLSSLRTFEIESSPTASGTNTTPTLRKVRLAQRCPIFFAPILKPCETNCGHIFDADNLATAWARNNSCPMCRTTLRQEDMHFLAS